MMSNIETKRCIIIGASHGGVNAAFSLRKEGWQGEIILIDSDSDIPYHRPPLSKAYLTDTENSQPPVLKSPASYEKSNITLKLGETVAQIDSKQQTLQLGDNTTLSYDKLILATGAQPFIPPITGISHVKSIFTLRSSADVNAIKLAFQQSKNKRVVIIGGGYIGLETAASIRKLGGTVTVIEREERLLARVTSPAMSEFFQTLHENNGVTIQTNQTVQAVENYNDCIQVLCDNNEQYLADIVIVGVGVKVNLTLAEQANLALENGIKVNQQCLTSNEHIYAIGDCAFHHNSYYDRWIRLESVQNAVDQAKIAAGAICNKSVSYNALPWFWSDQYEVKLQMVGLNTGFDEAIVRPESTDQTKFSVWYFKQAQLLAVDTVNHAKAYVLATKLLKQGSKINKSMLADSATELSMALQVD